MVDAIDTAAIGRTFVTLLRESLTEAEFLEVQRRNAAAPHDAGWCASHDFCDANVVMLEAFRRHGIDALGYMDFAELAPAEGTPEADTSSCRADISSDEICRLWLEAWESAMPALTE